MKHLYVQAWIAISGMMCISGCAGEVFNESAVSENTGVLRVMTRNGDEGTTPLSGASVYLFNSSNACVSILTSESTGAYASAKLPAGTYTLCALGGEGLSHLVLPTQTEATPTFVLTLAENQSLGDLLMKQHSVTLADGETEDVPLVLERKVLEISSVTISQVPDDVTGVQVSLDPLYGQVQLNGEYVTSSTAPCVITLTSQGSGTWAATPQRITFPSKSELVITITFTSEGAEPRSYSYTAGGALEANHKFNLEGTYTEPLGVTITGTITAQAWESNATDITSTSMSLTQALPLRKNHPLELMILPLEQMNPQVLPLQAKPIKVVMWYPSIRRIKQLYSYHQRIRVDTRKIHLLDYYLFLMLLLHHGPQFLV